jgi:hypothetical protein
MNRSLIILGAAALVLSPVLGAHAHDASPVAKAPPGDPYKEVSTLVKLPTFIPGMGQLFVDPSTLPAGPFLAYDHDGKLVSTIYMVPTAQMTPQLRLDDLASPGGFVDHVDMMFNAGHPGVAEPHIHVILWHIPAAEESRVAK